MLHHHHSFFHYLLNRELSEIYITVAIKFFALSLITIFIPIYLFQLGFDLKYIFLFFAIISAAASLTVYLSLKLSTKLGIKHGILISIPFLIAFYILLQFITTNSLNWIFFLAPIVGGIECSLFWTNFHTDFAAFSSKKFRARQVGGYMIISLILAAIGPILGAFIILNWDFNVLFVLVSILLLLSTLPLFMSEENYVHREFSFKKVRNVIKKAGPISMSGFIGQAMISCALCAWPIFIFLILRGYLDVGALTSLTFLIAIGSTFFIAKFADKFGRAKVLRIGSIFSSIGWIVRASVSTFLQIMGVNIFFGIIGPAYTGTTFDAKNYDMAKKRHIPEVIAFREITLHTSTALLFFLLFFIGTLKLALLFGVIGSILIFIFSFQKKKI
jgi:MFS family permease